jgi:hypothetical protein
MVGRIIHNDTLKKCSRIWDLDSNTSKTKSGCKLTSVIIERNEEVQITQNDFDIFVTKQFYAFLEDTVGDRQGFANMVLHQRWR